MMNNKFTVKVNNSYEFEFDAEDLSQLDAIAKKDNYYHLLHDGQSHHIAIEKGDLDTREYDVKVNGTSYAIAIFRPLDVLIGDLGFKLGAAALVSNITAPMPGLILEVLVSAGQEAQEGDTLLILEAMKMENSITSPRAGIVKSVDVSQGEAVDKQQLLITFE